MNRRSLIKLALMATAPEAMDGTTIVGSRPRPAVQPPRRAPAGLSSALLAVLCVAVALAMFGASYAVVSLLQ